MGYLEYMNKRYKSIKESGYRHTQMHVEENFSMLFNPVSERFSVRKAKAGEGGLSTPLPY